MAYKYMVIGVHLLGLSTCFALFSPCLFFQNCSLLTQYNFTCTTKRTHTHAYTLILCVTSRRFTFWYLRFILCKTESTIYFLTGLWWGLSKLMNVRRFALHLLPSRINATTHKTVLR